MKKDLKIFYDGVNIDEFKSHPDVVGFTTNLSFMAQGGKSDYNEFAAEALDHANGRPISFQVWADNTEDMRTQAEVISSWGDNVYVKVPIVTSEGESTVDLIKDLHSQGIKVNVTVVHSFEHLWSLRDIFNKETPVVVSVFAGGIADTGKSPEGIVVKCCNVFEEYSNVEVLWAGCQRVLNVIDAAACGCDIVTVPDAIMKKLDRLLGDKDLNDVAVAKSRLFREDAVRAKIEFT
jgi:transaldolase